MTDFTINSLLADHDLQKLIFDACNFLGKSDPSSSLYTPRHQSIVVEVAPNHRIFTAPIRINKGQQVFQYRQSKIVIGADFYKRNVAAGAANAINGDGYELVSAGITPENAMRFALSHEIAHLDESHRMALASTTHYEANSRFACAIRPSFPDEVNQLFRLAANIYRDGYSRTAMIGHQLLPIEVARAEDIASELCADLLGLHRLRKAGMITAQLEIDLAALRAAKEATSLAAYQISSEFNALIGLNDFDQIIRTTAEASISILKTGANIDQRVKTEAQKIKFPISLSHTNSEISLFTTQPTSIVGKVKNFASKWKSR